jgi:hypothetical protein
MVIIGTYSSLSVGFSSSRRGCLLSFFQIQDYQLMKEGLSIDHLGEIGTESTIEG